MVTGAPAGPRGWGERCPSKCLGVWTPGREGMVQEVGGTTMAGELRADGASGALKSLLQ